MGWFRRVLHSDTTRESEAKRQAALKIAEDAEEALEHSKMMRQLIIAETQYAKRVKGRGIPKRA